MSTSDLHLYVDAQFASPYAMSVFVALCEKGLAFEITPVDLSIGENHEAKYRALSLTERIPTLVHNGFSLAESSAITEYLDEVFPDPPLYPAKLQDRAKARQIQAWLRSDLMPIRNERSTEVIFYGSSEPSLSPEAVEAAKKLFYVAESLLSPGADNLFDQWCIADTDLSLMLNRLILHGDTVPERLIHYAKNQWERRSVQLWQKQSRPPL